MSNVCVEKSSGIMAKNDRKTRNVLVAYITLRFLPCPILSDERCYDLRKRITDNGREVLGLNEKNN